MKATRAMLADGSTIITEAGKDRCWDSEEVSTVEVEVEPGEHRCGICEELIDEPVGPFPQEPAFGSPEAERLAAERLYAGGSVFFRPGQEDVLTKRRASTGADVHYFIGPIRETFEEAEADRQLWATAAGMREQRDALADALVLAMPHFDSTWNGKEQRWEGGAPDEVWDAVRKALKLCGREDELIALGRQE